MHSKIMQDIFIDFKIGLPFASLYEIRHLQFSELSEFAIAYDVYPQRRTQCSDSSKGVVRYKPKLYHPEPR